MPARTLRAGICVQTRRSPHEIGSFDAARPIDERALACTQQIAVTREPVGTI